MTGSKLTFISKVGNWLLHLGWVSGYKTDWWNLKPQCSPNHGKPGHWLVWIEIILVILGQIEFSDCWFIFSENSVLCLVLTVFIALTVFLENWWKLCSLIMIGYWYQLVHWSHYGLTPVLLDGVKPCGLMINQLGYCNYMRFEENWWK